MTLIMNKNSDYDYIADIPTESELRECFHSLCKEEYPNLPDDIIIHYASEYYDPEKAHEYYMKHRQLKGRSKGSLTDKGKEIWGYTESNIKAKKKYELQEAALEKEVKIKELRDNTSKKKEEISNKLTQLLEAINSKYKEDTTKLTDTQKNQIEANNRLKKRDLEMKSEDEKRTKERLRERMKKELEDADDADEKDKIRSKYGAKINDTTQEFKASKEETKTTYSDKNAKVREETKKQKETLAEKKKQDTSTNRTNAKDEKAKVAEELKAAIEIAKGDYATKKEEINSKYEDVLNNEYDKIAAQYTKPKKTSKRKRR